MLKGEALEQSKLFLVCEYIKKCEYMFAVPNGGSRNPIEAKNLKRQGVKAGVPDIFLPMPSTEYHGLFVELKCGTNIPTKKQLEYLLYLNINGYCAVVCYSHIEALDIITRYLNNENLSEDIKKLEKYIKKYKI